MDGRYFAVLALAAALHRSQGHWVDFWLDNRRVYGHFSAPLSPWAQLDFDVELSAHLLFRLQVDRAREHLRQRRPITWPLDDPLAASDLLALPSDVSYRDRLSLDEVYLINLPRRRDRLALMEYALHVYGIDARLVEAVDGGAMSSSLLRRLLNLTQLAGYRDPFTGRTMTRGEVGCLLSHYGVWSELVASASLQRVLVLEDDVDLVPGFRTHLISALAEADRLQPRWDLVYLGRRRMAPKSESESEWPQAEQPLRGAHLLLRPGYSYWTLAYLLSRRGAQKLLAAQPLQHMLPVDEFLSVMFDRHPNADWRRQFATRDLDVLAVDPVIVQPLFTRQDAEYHSDTEASDLF
ncbi:unnamed protein product [Protopolystoma xenopodis]|uniref:Glycosyl transferase family 25 domain-containing protein n=1 Tax=Protopolystoma xenopodis TaxID=117903 RepID=A0A448X610_9PLAT|nr:unnamed protein product [Protopolystoma xenopodis]